LAHRYTARPEPSVRNVAPDAVAVLMTVAPLEPLAAEPLAAPAGGADVLEVPLEHAASTATAAIPPAAAARPIAGRDRAVFRFPLKSRITLVSRLPCPSQVGRVC
jgi:O-acetyl-ADP-ribose deacetylase (regulator of RNase III)